VGCVRVRWNRERLKANVVFVFFFLALKWNTGIASGGEQSSEDSEL
jgi:hypothetical protein